MDRIKEQKGEPKGGWYDAKQDSGLSTRHP